MSSVTIQIPYRQYPYPTEHKVVIFGIIVSARPGLHRALACNGNHSQWLVLFLTFSVFVANPKKLFYTVANPARGLLNREKITIEKKSRALLGKITTVKYRGNW